MGCVYKITDSTNNKSYIGMTRYTAKQRLDIHKYHAMKGNKSSFFQAIREHGAKNFTTETLFESDSDEELFRVEREMVKKYNTVIPNGYNKNSGGTGGSVNGKRKWSEKD